jgi:2-hydroxychromene-2-carboxylate isomerase
MAIFHSRGFRLRARLAPGALAVVVLTTGCAPLLAPPYAADYETLDRLEATRPGPVALVKAQPTEPEEKVNTVRLRSARLLSPSGSFAQYLQDALMRDLSEISVYDPKAPTRIAARILVNEIDLGVINGTGRMDVEVTVTRDGTQRLRKTYRAETAFDSSYASIVAVPAGQAAYPRLVRALLRQVYADPQFVAAIGR